LLVLILSAATRAGSIGLEMPAAGIDGGEGLAVRFAVRLSGAEIVVRDSAAGGFANPHQDEGVDNDVDLRNAPRIIAGFAADARISAAIGGLRRRVGDADSVAAQAAGLPTIVLARWSRNAPAAAAYCLCVSPGRLVAFARDAGRKRFGRRLLIVLVGDAAELKPTWAARWGAAKIAQVTDREPAIAAARRQAGGVDAVLVFADERPATLWQSAAFARWFDRAYVRSLGHREFQAVPAGARPGSVAVIETRLARGAARDAFERRFHAVAGYLPGDAATRAYAAAQIAAAAGTTRARVRQALGSHRFSTVAGGIAFDADGFANPYPLPAISGPAR
jgi:ABC-type branched-subunit amino acid transport system substrate-binding protein